MANIPKGKKRTPDQLKYHREYMQRYRMDHEEWRRINNAHRVERDKRNPVRRRERWASWYHLKRKMVIEGLGAKCSCCGEMEYEFLTLDHIHGGGSKHRKEIGGQFWKSILNEGCPKDKYRVLCFNCNMALAHNGYCPHSLLNVDVLGVAC